MPPGRQWQELQLRIQQEREEVILAIGKEIALLPLVIFPPLFGAGAVAGVAGEGVGILSSPTAGLSIDTFALALTEDYWRVMRLRYLRMQLVRQLRMEGEAAANIVTNTRRIESICGMVKYRVPDELLRRTLKDVKNVARLSFDSQMKDYLWYAIMTRRQFVLMVRESTILPKPLQDLVDAGWIILEYVG